MDFSVAKRNQFRVRLDMHVHMVANRALGFSDEVFTRAENLLRLHR